MVAAQHVADAGGRLLEGLVGGEVILIQRVEYAPVHGLEAVAHVRQGAPDNDGHGVVYIALLHLVDELRLRYDLIGECYILWFIISFMCHFISFTRRASNVEIDDVFGVALYPLAARLDVLAHEDGEYLVGLNGVVERDAPQ